MGKRGERLERATAIRDFALKVIGEKGRRETWSGIEVQVFEDERFSMVFYVRPPEPAELHFGLYSLELLYKSIGKVLNVAWDSVGEAPRIVSFRRGEWEELLLPAARRVKQGAVLVRGDRGQCPPSRRIVGQLA